MNSSSSRPPNDNPDRPLMHWYLRVEWLVLLLAVPLLLVPDAFPVATAGALLMLGIVWLFSVYIKPLPSTPFNLLLTLWGLVVIIGILASADPQETLPKATGLILGLGAWRLIVMTANSRQALYGFMGLTLLIALGFSFIGIFGLQEFPKIPALAQLNPFHPGALPGLWGLVVHPNQLAGVITLFLPLLVSLLFAPPAELSSPLWRLIFLLATLWTAWILLLTQSRGGWIATVAGLIALLTLWALALPKSRSRQMLRLAFVGLVIAAILLVIRIGPGTVWNLWADPPQETAVGTLTTLNFRKELWPWAVTAISDFPFTGVGLGTFRQVAFRLYPLPLSPGFDIGHAHNVFLQTALDVGLPGLAVYIAILLVAAAVGWQVARSGASYRAVSLGILAGLVAHHVYGLADALALGSKPGLVFWLLLGLLTAMRRLTPVMPENVAPGNKG